ncbi:hypothetical protein [Pyxidicoccus trucidator]|uniref:hypothetical protein n=1 Tax=Pyxidicoccus trucidator TaxID=2709662 RepID=UPI001F072257|nr:hypothetical protein [Pyxidicoccus trucidator]
MFPERPLQPEAAPPLRAARGPRSPGSAPPRGVRRAALLLGTLLSCTPAAEPPRLILWAWERPEDLRFLAGHPADVAFLLSTLELTGTDVLEHPRRQPLRLPPGVSLKATVRLEMHRGASLADFPPERLHGLAERLAALAHRPDVTALQLDFDARESEQDAYLTLLQRTRELLPQAMPLSITALASWCAPGSWLERAPVDEVVPQLFRMGPEAPAFRTRFARGLPRPCKGSVGLALDEWQAVPPGVSTLYLFSPRPWTPEAFARAVAGMKP